MQKNSTWWGEGGGGLGWNKGRFKVLHFTNTDISFTLPLSLLYAMMKFLRVRKLSEFKMKAMQRKTLTQQFLI